jgi:hypothetical protein
VLIDQFEELFNLADEDEAARFLTALTDTLREDAGRVRVVVTLRGDFYDRPLLHPAFAEVFTSSIVNVLPLDLPALEAAVTEPARQVGVEVEPALLAELLTDTVGQPGALPLFQYALTELFDHRDGGAITLRCYRELGGLHGALSRRAEGTYAELAPHQQELAKQVFLRLVSPGHGTADVRRRVTATELRGLDLDPVELADVLERLRSPPAAHLRSRPDHRGRDRRGRARSPARCLGAAARVDRGTPERSTPARAPRSRRRRLGCLGTRRRLPADGRPSGRVPRLAGTDVPPPDPRRGVIPRNEPAPA